MGSDAVSLVLVMNRKPNFFSIRLITVPNNAIHNPLVNIIRYIHDIPFWSIVKESTALLMIRGVFIKLCSP